MEIEAKLSLPDSETFRRLQAIDHLAGFALSAGQVKQVRDTYLDTADRLVLAAGYACRQREQDDGVLVTLKELKGAESAVHRREELEVWLPADRSAQSPAHELDITHDGWPASPVRDRVSQLIGDASLMPLFALQQMRFVRQVSCGEQLVAELSLDEVHLALGDREQTYFELEVELAPQGTEDDLAAIVTHLQDEWGLEPEPRSKFERALAFLEEMTVKNRLLTPEERAICQQIAGRDDLYARRALALLSLDEGATQAKAGQRAGLSARRVRYWLAEFRQRRLEVFPDRVLAEAQSVPPSPLSEPLPQPVESPQPLPLEVLFDRYGVDRAHARTVADRALALFDGLSPFHGLPPERRPLLETAALLHNVGLQTDPASHHIAGRDILLAHPPTELDDHERLVVALISFLHCKRITPKKLEKLTKTRFAILPEPLLHEALALAALVRLADGLDYSETGTSQLEEVRQQEGIVEIEVVGPHAAMDAERAGAKSDLWRLLFETDLRFKPPAGAEISVPERSVEPVPRSLPDKPGLEADDSMAEAARKTFFFHLQRMLYHEPGTRLGEDIEELHDMRVATRRMRAAFRVFGDYLDMEQMSPFVKGLRRTGRALGAVRDLDVFWEKTQRYLDNLPPGQQVDLEPLQTVWKAERERARERMLAYLDSDRYIRFKARFGEFLQKPGAGALPVLSRQGEPLPHRLRHVVPVAVYQRLAAVRAYDEWVTGPDVPLERLHQLRIAAKGLRYTVEYFWEVLGREAKVVIDQIKALQDHLGDLQDAVVASNLLRDFLTWGTWGRAQTKKERAVRPPDPIIAPGVASYLAARQTELQGLVETFPKVWARFQNPEFSQLVTSVVAGL
jgi:CHAD domain-containing protein